MAISPKRFEITLSIWYSNSSGAQALSIGNGYGPLGGRMRKKVGQSSVSALGYKRVGNDSFQHLKMFGEVSKPLSVEMNEIWSINQTSEIALEPVFSTTLEKYQFSKFL